MPEPRIIHLTEQDSERLKKWLALFEVPPEGINRGRYFSMQFGTRWISIKELEVLNDAFPPYGMATDVIRGGVEISEAAV